MEKTNLISRRKILGFAGSSTLIVPTIGYQPTQVVADLLAEIHQPSRRNDAEFLKRAFEMRQTATSAGDQPYGAAIVRNNEIIGQSPSRVIISNDPTAHAEMEAIRDAANRLGSRNLANCTLFSSSKACPMCEAAAYWAGITRMVYGSSGTDGGYPELC